MGAIVLPDRGLGPFAPLDPALRQADRGCRIVGIVGQIKWSYYMAAAINGYDVRRKAQSSTWMLGGQIVIRDPFKLAQRPLIFVAVHQHGDWRWPILELELHDSGHVTAYLGPPVE